MNVGSKSLEPPHACGVARLSWRKTLLFAAGLTVFGLLLIPVDGPVAHFFLGGGCPGELDKLFDLSEVFGHATGAALVIVSVLVLDPRGWRVAAWVAGAAYAGGLSADVFKLLLGRTRPSSVQGPIVGWDTFQGWFPLVSAGHAGQSFPSAHTATAAGLAVALSTLYPRGRWLFLAFAVLAGCQRIESGAHFPSDVAWGGAVGLVAGTAVMQGYVRWMQGRAERSAN